MSRVKNFAVELLGVDWARLVLLAIEMLGTNISASMASNAYSFFLSAFSKLQCDASQLDAILLEDMGRIAQAIMFEMSVVEEEIDNTDDENVIESLQDELLAMTYAVMFANQMSVLLEDKLSEELGQ